MFTNIGLVNLAKKALSEKWGYVNGTFGNILTESLMNQKCSQGGGVGEYNSYWKDSYIKNFIGKRVSDCYGLVKAYVWWNSDNSSPTYNTNGCVDRNQETAYRLAREKGPLSTMPEIPGIILWMKGHVGIYIGNGEFIECRGCPHGTVKGTVKNGVVTSGSKFTHWFKDNWIVYTVPVSPKKTFTVQEAKTYIQQETKIDDNTKAYLMAYKYDESLFTKLATAMYEDKFSASYKNKIMTETLAADILKKIGLADTTIQFLKDDYKFGGSLVIKLAQAMV